MLKNRENLKIRSINYFILSQPFTYYLYKLSVCTYGGCNTSEPEIIRIYEEAPLHVEPPFV